MYKRQVVTASASAGEQVFTWPSWSTSCSTAAPDYEALGTGLFLDKWAPVLVVNWPVLRHWFLYSTAQTLTVLLVNRSRVWHYASPCIQPYQTLTPVLVFSHTRLWHQSSYSAIPDFDTSPCIQPYQTFFFCVAIPDFDTSPCIQPYQSLTPVLVPNRARLWHQSLCTAIPDFDTSPCTQPCQTPTPILVLNHPRL